MQFNLVAGQSRHYFESRRMDLLIDMGEMSGAYMGLNPKEVWRVNPDGQVRDTWRKITHIFDMQELDFFRKYSELSASDGIDLSYYEDCKAEDEIYVTSRKQMTSRDNLHYIQGNAKDPDFFVSLLNRKYDVIIDFMVYGTDELERRLPELLSHTDQYCFFSSSRVYAESRQPITEESPRLLDVCTDQEYLHTDEYALAKAREEDLLRKSKEKNWTIIRPYITYNDYRLQLGVYEKENWLYRALQGRTIVLPKDIADRKTSLTFIRMRI